MLARLGVSGEAVRIALFYFVFCAISGFYTPYWSVFLESRGVTAAEIGLIFAAGCLLRPLVVPAWGFAADRYLGLKRTLVVLSTGIGLALSLFWRAEGFAVCLAVTLLAMLAWAPILPLTDALALGHQANGRLTYGRVRLWGSISYILTVMSGGAVLSRFGPDAIWMAVVALCVLLAIAAVFQQAPKLAHTEAPRPTVRELIHLLTGSRLGLVLIAAGLIDATHTMYYGFATIHWRAIGIPGGHIGALWSIGVVAEVVLLAFAGKWLRQSSGLPFIVLAGGAAIVRWSLLSLDPGLPALYAVQLIHALTYSVNLLGVMTYIQKHTPHRFAGSVQGVYAALAAGIFAAGAMALSGRLYASFGAHAYLAMAGIAVLGLIVAALAWRAGKSGAPELVLKPEPVP